MMMRGRQFAMLLLALVGLFLAGCHRLPFHRVDRSLDPRQLGHARAGNSSYPEVAEARPEVPLPPLPLQPVSDHEALGQAQETPLLDAALVRAQAEQDAVVGSPSDPSRPEAEATPTEADAAPETATAAEPAPLADQPAPSTDADPAPEALPGPIRTLVEPQPDPAPEFVAPETVVEANPVQPPAPADEPMPTEPAVETPEIAVEPEPAPELAVEPEAAPPSAPPPDVSPPPEQNPPAPLLTIADLRLCRRVSGFGKFELVEGPLSNGQVFVLYCELAGVRYEPDGESFRSEIEAAIELRSEADGQRTWSQSLGRAEDRCRRPRQDFYVNYRLTLPGANDLPPGRYRLVLTQRDRLAEVEAVSETSITVATPAR